MSFIVCIYFIFSPGLGDFSNVDRAPVMAYAHQFAVIDCLPPPSTPGKPQQALSRKKWWKKAFTQICRINNISYSKMTKSCSFSEYLNIWIFKILFTIGIKQVVLIWPSGELNDFWKSSVYFHNVAFISHWKNGMVLNVNPHHLRMKFWATKPSGYGEEGL